ncbi:esterase/lipase family protein [Rhodoferax ferrireducens]|uniref:esterase/lipase family protein n=1 Tax=Rhodoferax ferrireducens TaxID=192843 RepID=UPI000E0DE91A|nr:alpha/beta fold hydrolase [Rhodoferax ferrireducens]
MLSRLLRRLLLGQVLAGALLGWLIARRTDTSPWIAAVTALGFPLVMVLLVASTTAILSRAPGANALWWRSLFSDFVAVIRVFLLQQPWAVAPPGVMPATAAPPRRIPVLLVHGYLCNHRVWDVMAPRLRGAGHPVLALDLEPLFTSIDRYVPLIEQGVAELCRQTGSDKVVLLGHSMGGLVIRAWMRTYGTSRVARVITLGTPHAGTRMAARSRTDNARQMFLRSPWLQDLAASETEPTRSLMRIGITPQDNIVYPQREQVLEGVPVTVFDGLGHLDLCLNGAVIAWVLQQLEDPALR